MPIFFCSQGWKLSSSKPLVRPKKRASFQNHRQEAKFHSKDRRERKEKSVCGLRSPHGSKHGLRAKALRDCNRQNRAWERLRRNEPRRRPAPPLRSNSFGVPILHGRFAGGNRIFHRKCGTGGMRSWNILEGINAFYHIQHTHTMT